MASELNVGGITTTGNVGVGVTPVSGSGIARFLHIGGSTAGIVLEDTDGPNKWEQYSAGGNLKWEYNGGSSALSISSANLSHFTTDVAGDTEVIRVENVHSSSNRNVWISFYRASTEYGRLGTSDGHLSLQSQGGAPVRVIEDGGNGMSIADGGLASFSHGIAFSGQTDASGTGITSGASTLNHYEQGTWTPVVASNTGTSTTYSVLTGRYTRIGDVVTVFGAIRPNNGTLLNFSVTGAPFAGGTVQDNAGSAINASNYNVAGSVTIYNSTIYGTLASASPNNEGVSFTLQYKV